MCIARSIETLFKRCLPSPFTIAVLLTFVTLLLAWLLTSPAGKHPGGYFIDLLGFWEKGLWDGPLMVFALQMMLMLVLGHVLALTGPVDRFIKRATSYCDTTARAAAMVTLLTLLVAFFNWGLGLIFGAIFARKVAEAAVKKNNPLNYPLIGAAGYSGLMVWHGGISGSAPVKASESGHLKALMQGIYSPEELAGLPELISFSDTVFSPMNGVLSLTLLIILPLVMYRVGKRSRATEIKLSPQVIALDLNETPQGAEKLDQSSWLARIFGGLILLLAFYKALIEPEHVSLNFITPNFINFVLLGLGILLHGHFKNYLRAIDEAITGASGILIQFPLYFGIMGIMKYSGLVAVFSEFFVSISNESTFPVFTFISAGIVNVFVPSGGGQWGVQGPIIIEASRQLGLPLSKGIMALAYGDQLTNMLQPFWALPLLGITGLKAKEILPYTLVLMLVGALVFITALLLF